MVDRKFLNKYWRVNLRLITLCLSIWFTVSFVFGILLVQKLNLVVIAGYPLGFWFAQQGSIFSFVILIFFYIGRVNKLEKEFSKSSSLVDGSAGKNPDKSGSVNGFTKNK